MKLDKVSEIWFPCLLLNTHNRHNGWLAVLWKSIRAVVQHTEVIIGGIEMRHLFAGVFVKIIFCAGSNIFPFDCDVIVTIVCTLHVIETESWKNLVENLWEFSMGPNLIVSDLRSQITWDLPCKNSCIIVPKRKQPCSMSFFCKFNIWLPCCIPTSEWHPSLLA